MLGTNADCSWCYSHFFCADLILLFLALSAIPMFIAHPPRCSGLIWWLPAHAYLLFARLSSPKRPRARDGDTAQQAKPGGLVTHPCTTLDPFRHFSPFAFLPLVHTTSGLCRQGICKQIMAVVNSLKRRDFHTSEMYLWDQLLTRHGGVKRWRGECTVFT